VKFILLMLVVILFAAVFPAKAGNGKISGCMFGDYYYISSNHNEHLEGRNGFWLRRVYLTYDQELSDTFSARLRLEMAHPDGLGKSADKAVPFIKDAYLSWKTGNHQVLLGISSTPTWSVVEKTWGYRSVEKTPQDLQKFGNPRDFGIAMKGKLDSAGKFKYHLMLGNGNSNKSENDKGKKVMLSVGFYPTKSVIVEIYGDWVDKPGDTDWTTLQAFVAYKAKKMRLGFQYAHQTRKGDTDLKLNVGSVFGVFQLSKKVSFLARVDRMFDPNPSGETISYIPFSSEAKSTFIVGGLDFKVHKQVSIMPNIEVIIYHNPGSGDKPTTDVIPRLTFYFKF
jgi:hypothetical protein